MNRITAEQALEQVGRQSKTAPLRNEILDLEPGEAIEVSFDEFKPGTVTQVAGNLSRKQSTRKFSVRKRRDGNGCFIICQSTSV
jgi:multidrug resistance efflux pump